MIFFDMLTDSVMVPTGGWQ